MGKKMFQILSVAKKMHGISISLNCFDWFSLVSFNTAYNIIYAWTCDLEFYGFLFCDPDPTHASYIHNIFRVT